MQLWHLTGSFFEVNWWSCFDTLGGGRQGLHATATPIEFEQKTHFPNTKHNLNIDNSRHDETVKKAFEVSTNRCVQILHRLPLLESSGQT